MIVGMYKYFTSNFLLLTPIILLFGVGIFVKSYKKAVPQVACTTQNLTGAYDPKAYMAIYHDSEVEVPTKLTQENYAPNTVLGVATPDEKWIEVDLSEQKLKAWDGNNLFLETLVSTGLPWWKTPTGEFRIWVKLRATKMEGGEGRYYYNLPNVPYVMFFENDEIPGWRGYGLHGTYWHNDFGTPRSHGCVNLPTPVAEKLYYWTTPTLQSGTVVHSSEENPGTRIIIHE